MALFLQSSVSKTHDVIRYKKINIFTKPSYIKDRDIEIEYAIARKIINKNVLSRALKQYDYKKDHSIVLAAALANNIIIKRNNGTFIIPVHSKHIYHLVIFRNIADIQIFFSNNNFVIKTRGDKKTIINGDGVTSPIIGSISIEETKIKNKALRDLIFAKTIVKINGETKHKKIKIIDDSLMFTIDIGYRKLLMVCD